MGRRFPLVIVLLAFTIGLADEAVSQSRPLVFLVRGPVHAFERSS